MQKLHITFLFCLWVFSLAAQTTGIKTYAYQNGNWYNGTAFANATWYVVNGQFTKKAPAQIDSTIDLAGLFVVPPMGDAYSASLTDLTNGPSMPKNYMDEGIFYIQAIGNTQAGYKAIAEKVNRPTAPDAVFSNGAITCTLGYPFVLYEGPANGIFAPQMMGQRYEQIKLQNKMLGDGYWFIDNKASLDANWPKILAQKPGLINIYLLDAATNGGKEGKGLTPEVAKMVVKKAKKAGLPVYAHIETADDVRLALKIGVSGITNIPGNAWDGQGDATKFTLTDEDLKKLAKKKTVVIPQLSQAQQTTSVPAAVTARQAEMLKRLFDNGVNVAIGSNDPQRSIRGELNYWFQLGKLNYNSALKTLCETTPRAIFPKRKIGRIEEGYEASFLVLNDNPLNNILKLRAISFKVKNGVVLK